MSDTSGSITTSSGISTSGSITLIAGNATASTGGNINLATSDGQGFTKRLQTLVSPGMYADVERAVREGRASSVGAFVRQALERELGTGATVDKLTERVETMERYLRPVIPVTLANHGGGVYTFVPGDVRLRASDGKVWSNVTGGTLPVWVGAGPVPTVNLGFQAEEFGWELDGPLSVVQGPAGVIALRLAPVEAQA